MRKLFLTLVLTILLGATASAQNAPYAQQRSLSQADVATIAPSMAGEKPRAENEEAPKTAVIPQIVPVVDDENKPKPHWDYSAGEGGPHRWSKVDPQFLLCGTGRKQSPVNISKFYQEDLPAIEVQYASVPLALENNGHTLQFNYAEGSGIMIDGLGYRLKTIDFHTPSEHYIDGAPYPMEAHFIHQSDDGSLAVISVMIKAGAYNKFIEALWHNAPATMGEEKRVEDVRISAADLMPQTLEYYRYDGSLTTPPCTEGVQWMVLKQPIEISEEQIRAFQKLFPANARPVQPLGNRVVTGD